MTEKTEDLIAEARGPGLNTDDLILRLADALEAATSERDAALAAIERVRKYADERSVYAKTRNNIVGSWRIASDLYDLLGVSHEEQAALDGAPEPEWEYSVCFNDPEYGWTNDTADIHDNYEDARDDYSEPYWTAEDRVMRRRKAGPWLPVEGEKP